MKVLLCEMSQNQRRKFRSLIDSLESLGHEVVVKPMRFDEDLSTFDRVFVGLNLLSTEYHWYGLGVLGRRPDAIALFDSDIWQANRLLRSYQSHLHHPENWRNWRGTTDWEVVRRARPMVEAGANALVQGKRRIVFPAFPGGRPHKIFKSILGNCERWDVRTYCPLPFGLWDEPIEVPPKDRLMQWNCFSVNPKRVKSWIDNENLTWPIRKFGSKGLKLPTHKAHRVYAEDWGCLLPGNGHSGSGWYRPNAIRALRSGNCIYGPKKTQELILGKAFSSAEIEENPYGVAKEQSALFFKTQRLLPEFQLEEVKHLLEESRNAK